MKKIFVMFIAICCFCIAGCSSDPAETYKLAKEEMKKENWEEAIELFNKNSDYKDSKKQIEKCKKEKGMRENCDYEFLDAISKSIMERYEHSNKQELDVQAIMEIDLLNLKEFKTKKFYDKNLRELALAYIEGVEEEIKYNKFDSGKRQIPFYKAKSKRYKALKELTDKYGMLKDNTEYICQYYEKYDINDKIVKAIEEIIATLEPFSNPKRLDIARMQVNYQNTTNYDFDMDIWYIHYDSNKNVLQEDGYSFHFEKNKSYVHDIYVHPDSASCEWVADIYPNVE